MSEADFKDYEVELTVTIRVRACSLHAAKRVAKEVLPQIGTGATLEGFGEFGPTNILVSTARRHNCPTVPEVLPLARAYCAKPGNGTGGNLPLVLSDKNVKNTHVRYCLAQAEASGDTAGVELASKLFQMSKTQRLKLASSI